MGKARRTKSHPKTINPTGLPDSREFEDAEVGTQSLGGPVDTMLEQVQSATADEQLSGLQLLATLTENPAYVISLIESDVIRIVGPLLTARNNDNLRLATVGALRNLSTCGVEVCDALFEQDLMTPLLALLNDYRGEWEPMPVKDQDEAIGKKHIIDVRTEIFVSSVHLLSNICESNSDALDAFNNSNLLQSVLRCVDHTIYGLEVGVAVAQLMLIVSEDNSAAWRTFQEFESNLVALMKMNVKESRFGEVLLRTLATGIVSNVPSLSLQHLSLVIRGLDRPFAENHRQLLNSLSSDIPLMENMKRFDTEVQKEEDCSEADDEMETDEDHARVTRQDRETKQVTELEKQIKNVGYLLESQRIAAEILTNICSSEDDTLRMEDDGNNSGTDDDEVVHDYDTSTGVGEVAADKLPVEILEAIKSLCIVEKLWQRAQPIAENVNEILLRHEPMLAKKLKLLRVSCLLCLHNLCNVMSTEDLGGSESLYKVWLEVSHHIFQGVNKKDTHLLEASTALMRATLEHLKGNVELFAAMQQSDLDIILTGVRQCNEPEIRANWLRILGTLGCLLSEPLVKGVIQYLLESSLQEEDAWTISEAMDALMDMFADNEWPNIAVELQLGQIVKQLERMLKNKLRQQKKELGERYTAVATVRTNLARFGRYVETEVLKGKR